MESQIIYILPVILVVLVIFSAFFAMSEVAFVSLNKMRLRYLLNQNMKNAQIVHRIIKKMDKLIATILVGNNFVNIAISSIGTAIFIYFWGNNYITIAISTIVITLIVLIVGEITPKIFAVKHAEKVSLRVAWFMDLIIQILHPIVKVSLNISNLFLKLLGEPPPKRSPLVSEEEIRLMIELGKEEGVLTDGERSMLHRIFEFGDTLVYEVMMPVEKVIAIDINSTADELLDAIVEKGHSRIPVYDGDMNNICGVIYARELLNVWRNKDLIIIQDLLHPPYFINSRKRVSELLREFQKIHVYMAIVTDERKNTLGLVTLEDLIEEIVGEIEGDVS
ncbi:MAG: HlyC/CorC family transporter [Candidatus Omnitrophica bacterium]|nr:HlyC/CorC family transporter [Candidatus Omnitrophota bacterium]